MVDICNIFRYIEKEAQKPDIIIPDIIRYRDIALQKLGLLAERHYPGNSCFIFCTLILYKVLEKEFLLNVLCVNNMRKKPEGVLPIAEFLLHRG